MLVAVDFETYLIEPGNLAPRAVCLSYAGEDDEKGIFVGQDIPACLEMLLSDDKVVLVGHNMGFDMLVAIQNYPHLARLVWDAYSSRRIQCTYCREKLLDIAVGRKGDRGIYHLAHLVKKHFGVELDKTTWRTSYDELDGVELELWPQGAIDYAVLDSVVTRDLYLHQVTRAQVLEYGIFEEEAACQASYDVALKATTARGVMVDQKQVQMLKETMAPLMEEATATVLEAGLFHKQTKKDLREGKYRKNLQQIRQLVSETYPGTPPETPKHAICTDAETISQCHHPALNALSKLNGLVKIDSTYLEVFRLAGNRPVHARYDVLQNTGRTSSYGPNIQNQPRLPGIRECIRARKGWVFISCDYDSQELRTLGQACEHLTGHSALANRFKMDPDYDPHTHFASQLLHLTYEEALERKAAGDAEVLDFRQRAKAANFGFPGGLGAETFLSYAQGYGIVMTLDGAKALRDRWFEQWPEMREYFRHITQLVDAGGTLVQIGSGRIRGKCGYCDGANSYFQGLAADASKNALFEVTKACFMEPGASPLAGCRPVWFVHDEIGIEAPESYAHEAALELERVMVEAMEEVCETVPARASAAMMRRWSKKAKRVLDADGRMIPWEDAQ